MVWFLSSDKTLLKAAFAVLEREDEDIRRAGGDLNNRETRLRGAVQKVANGVWFFSSYLKRRLQSLEGRAYYGYEIKTKLNSLNFNGFSSVVKIIKVGDEILKVENPMDRIVKTGTRVLEVKKTKDDRPVFAYEALINVARGLGLCIYNLDEKGFRALQQELNRIDEESEESLATARTHLTEALPGFFLEDYNDWNAVKKIEYPFS